MNLAFGVMGTVCCWQSNETTSASNFSDTLVVSLPAALKFSASCRDTISLNHAQLGSLSCPQRHVRSAFSGNSELRAY
jgi:hypothetical protein